jgi:hypothetical protein
MQRSPFTFEETFSKFQARDVYDRVTAGGRTRMLLLLCLQLLRTVCRRMGKSKILKISSELFVSGLSICEPTIPKATVIVQIYGKLHENCQ